VIELTPEQKQAASAPGSVAVTAGAGTGKTGMLAGRYLHHVKEQGLSPLSVVAVTFTEKAAAELRSRIRKTLIERFDNEQAIAEVEAAQISTMHSLAARICRDFYDLAGVPADFTILDETGSPLWLAEKFDEAVGAIDPAIIEEMGFYWLTSMLNELLKDPYSSEKALALGPDNWRRAIEAESARAVAELTSRSVWDEVQSALRSHSGTPGDTLEGIRAQVLELMPDVTNAAGVEMLHSILKSFRSNSGSAANWDPSALTAVRESLSELKAAVKDAHEIASLAFGPEDEKAAARVAPLAAAFRQVRDFIAAEKLREKVLDFGDLEHYALKVLRFPEAAAHYSARWRAFLVDEFQDTNPIQAEILSLLTRDAHLTIVGDEKQAIYGFRGADIGVFSRVRDELAVGRGGSEVPLSLTFRSHADLVVTMNTIFEPILEDLHQPLTADRTDARVDAPFVHSAVVEKVEGPAKKQLEIIEARYIADLIEELHAAGVKYGDMAILSRVWAPLDVYLGVLSAKGIPAVHAGGGSLLDTREASDIYALLGFLTSPSDDIPLVALLRSPFFAVDDRTLLAAAAEVNDERSWWDVIQPRAAFGRPAAVLSRLLKERDSNTADGIFALADELTGYSAVAANLPYGSRRSADIRGVRELFRELERRGQGDVFGTTRFLRELIATETAIPRPPLDAGEAVSLMTIHKAKGLEWPVVFIPDLARGNKANTAPILIDSEVGVAFTMEGEAYEKEQPAIFKLIKARVKQREAGEARRLLYVALTRAKDKVVLTATGANGGQMDILRPGLAAAGIEDEIIPYKYELAVAPDPGEPPKFELPANVQVEPVTAGLSELPVSALSIYARCPRQFEFQFVEGHPGVSDGAASAMLVGSLTHLALELGTDDPEKLRNEFPECTDEDLRAAAGLAGRFRSHPAYDGVRVEDCRREERFSMAFGGVRLNGIADLVGPDFVLDYKTDREMHPEEHRFQLWAYAEAFKRPRALIAYLQHDKLHEWNSAEIAEIGAEAAAVFERIRRADYAATPSPAKCEWCPFEKVCGSSAKAE